MRATLHAAGSQAKRTSARAAMRRWLQSMNGSGQPGGQTERRSGARLNASNCREHEAEHKTHRPARRNELLRYILFALWLVGIGVIFGMIFRK
jgi:hypothetical protein